MQPATLKAAMNSAFATAKVMEENKANQVSQDQARNQGGGHLGHFPPEIFKTVHRNFDICRNFQRIKIQFLYCNYF